MRFCFKPNKIMHVMCYHLAYIIFLLAAVSTGVYSRDCTLTVQDKSPLLLGPTRLKFVISSMGKITLRKNQRISLSCPNNGNHLTTHPSTLAGAACVGNSVLRIENTNSDFEDISCKRRIKGEVQKTYRFCGNDQGQIYYIGYNISGSFVNLIEVCYDEDGGITLYTKHILYGKEAQSTKRRTSQIDFSTAGLDSSIPISEVYKKTTQISTFKKLLGSDGLISSRSYLARGHLSPRTDFIYPTFQDSTFFYLNTCPQWQVINNGNWKSVEDSIRKTAANFDKEFIVASGTHGILSLNDASNISKEIFLFGDKLPVPKYVWKIVYNNHSKEGIVFIVLNNPFAEKIAQDDKLCNSICDTYGWSISNWNDPTRGFVQCCDLESFTNIIRTAPKFKADRILHKKT